MRPSESTPLLGSQQCSSGTQVESRTYQSTLHEQDESQQVLEGQCSDDDDENSLLSQNNTAKTAYQSVQNVSNNSPDLSPPSCKTALFLVLLFSLFISNIEGSLLLTIHSQIASTFHQPSRSQWLIIAYPLACSAAEPVMGSLSDGIGRKPLLLISYTIFSLAATICGMAPSFSVFVIGRVMAGVGGSGMIAMVNLIVSDLVGLKELAGYRSWFQAAMATGRLCGGPVGGLLMERVGWRLVFVSQTPVLLLAAGACSVLIPSMPSAPVTAGGAADGLEESKSAMALRRNRIWTIVQQVDVGGSFLLVCTITMGLISLNLFGDGYTIHDSWVSGTLGLCLVCGGLLFVVERYLVAKPMLSRRILSNLIVVGVYSINILGMVAQSSLTFILPLEQRILHSSTADRAGLQLLPLVAGNVCGSIAAGIFIKRGFTLTKMFSTAMIITTLARAALYLSWYSTGPILRLLPLVVIGVSSSVTFASTFIFLNGQITKRDQAMAVTCLFCLYGIGSAAGTTGSKVMVDSMLRWRLVHRLGGQDLDIPKIIASIMSDGHLVKKLPQAVQATIQQSVRDSFSASRVLSLASQVATLPCLLLLRPAVFKIGRPTDDTTDEE